ncbi:MAG: hypothetical protein ABF271_12075 [Abyssibacter sp.]|uniref:hypothetical protein n=1 Tax=Abyssibacter sp. TaxID=2320200 RepID=UPI00321A1F5F
MRSTVFSALGLVMAGLASQPVAADETSIVYTRVGVSQAQLDYETSGSGLDQPEAFDLSGDADALTFDVSVAVRRAGPLEALFLAARYSDGEYDNDTAVSAARIGLGKYFIGEGGVGRLSFNGRLNYEEYTFGDNEEITQDGYSLTGQLRAYIDTYWEIGVGAGWVDLGEPQGFRVTLSTAIELPYQFFLTAEWETQSLNQDFDRRTSDDIQQDQSNLRLGLRKDFNLF